MEDRNQNYDKKENTAIIIWHKKGHKKWTTCSVCAMPVTKDANFCYYCGAKFVGEIKDIG